MRYWSLELNFAFWCATTGRGISRKTLDIVPEQVNAMAKSFLLCHIYFTMRTFLSELALPGDPTFSEINQNYDIPSYKRICAEFGINADLDFRFKRGLNHGLRNVYIFISYVGPS